MERGDRALLRTISFTFFPSVHAEIEWASGYVFPDKELQGVVRDAEPGRRLVDEPVKDYTCEGTEAWVLAVDY